MFMLNMKNREHVVHITSHDRTVSFFVENQIAFIRAYVFCLQKLIDEIFEDLY